MEERNGKLDSADSAHLEESPYLGKESFEANGNGDDEVFRRETEENNSGNKKAKTQDDTFLEANTDGSDEEAQIVGSEDSDKKSKKVYQAFKNIPTEHDEENLIPQKAPPELVLVVAKESALLGPDKDSGNEVDRKKILRSGNYWNGVWKEEVNVKSLLLRSDLDKKVLGSIKAKIKPGSEFYKVVSRMKKISPRLLYIINKKQLS